MIDPGTQENGEDYLAYNRRRWGGRLDAGASKGRKVARSRLENLAEHWAHQLLR